jgi:multiple sugar transport system ATP-binding protein
MVAGLEPITEGQIRIGNKIVNDVPAKDRDIAMVFQNYALYPHMTVQENIGFGLKLRRVAKPEISHRVSTAGAMLELLDQFRKKPRDLSGGQRQRVAMGRAIVRAPQVFLMDEPLSNLDAKLRVQMRVEIARIQRDLGVTMIYVTHDQTEAMTLGDTVAVMRDGVVQQMATPQELFDRPRNMFVAGFMGSPPMNLAHALLMEDETGLFADLGGHRLHIERDVLDARPEIGQVVGDAVVLGIRPEDFKVASRVQPSSPVARMNVRVDIRETLGRESYLYFDVPARPALVDDLRGYSAAQTTEDPPIARTTFVARVDARTDASVGDSVELAVQAADFHFFDPESGTAIDGHART